MPDWVRNASDRLAIEQGCYFDEAAGAFVCSFIERFCRQSKGRWAGQPLELLPWQRDFLMRLFGWRKADGSRRFRRAYLEVAKKNGKSTLVSGLSLFLLLADGRESDATGPEGAPEVYINACDRDQASIVFDEAARMVRRSPGLSQRLDIKETVKRIVEPKGGGKLVANSSEVPSKDGVNASGIIFDELHRQPNRELWEVMEYAGAARLQPLTVSITTAGEEEEGVWFDQRLYSEKVADGIIPDTSHLGVVYRALDADDIDDPATWRKANPSLGVTISEDDFRRELEEAKQSPAKLANFRRLRLNIISREAGKFIDPADWDACNAPPDPFDPAAEFYAGLDLSTVNDLTALSVLVPKGSGSFDVHCRFWLPEDNIARLEHQHGQPYRQWARMGLIELTPGNNVDYGFIRRAIQQFDKGRGIRLLAYDPWKAHGLIQDLVENDGIPALEVRQGPASLSSPTQDLLRLALARKLRHGGHPILRWHVLNAVVRRDSNGNIKLDKEKSRQKIDGAAALVNALAAATSEPSAEASVYESRGILSL